MVLEGVGKYFVVKSSHAHTSWSGWVRLTVPIPMPFWVFFNPLDSGQDSLCLSMTIQVRLSTGIRWLDGYQIFPGPETWSSSGAAMQLTSRYSPHFSTLSFPTSRLHSQTALWLPCLSASKYGCHSHFYWGWWSYFELDR